MKYLADRPYTMARIAELVASVEFARYELAAALKVSHDLGLKWTELAPVLGMTRQGCGQFARRQMMHLQEIPDEEYERLCRLLGIGDKVPRYEVREIVSGKPGVSKVTRLTLSQHLKRDVAERIARDRGPAVEVWQVNPDGTEAQQSVSAQPRPKLRNPAELDPDGMF